jgi:hypothetical protein
MERPTGTAHRSRAGAKIREKIEHLRALDAGAEKGEKP